MQQTDLTDEVLHRLIIIIIKKQKGKNKYAPSSYNIYITILVRFWKIFKRYFSVSGRGEEGSSLVFPFVVILKVLFVIVVFILV